MRKLMMIELNEVNFDFIRGYAACGALPNFQRLIDRHGIVETTSETDYANLEPWIQWVTAHTGRSLKDHGVFRLGDILERPDIAQIWETLEAAGVSVGAISPMNARNACQNAAFFVPDPWTRSTVTGSPLVRNLYDAITQLVNDNAEGKADKASLVWLGAGLARYAAPGNYARYIAAMAKIRQPWQRALILDLLLADLFAAEVRRTDAQFTTLFLNAAAHIQHHYLFNSAIYRGPNANPVWYIAADQDPLLDVYRLYDRILGRLLRAFPDRRLIVATGLHQDPYPTTLFYWRLRDHAAFLTELGIPHRRAEPRMSRDFVVFCDDQDQAFRAEAMLTAIVADDGQPLFEVDNRGDSLFVMLVYGADIAPTLGYRLGDRHFSGLKDKTAFVAIKNGEHNGIGYLIDTADAPGEHPEIPLTAVHDRILTYFRGSPPVSASAAAARPVEA